MHMTIDLSERTAVALESQARAAHMPVTRFLNAIVERALGYKQPEVQSSKPKKSAYGLLAKYGPGPSEQDIDDNRREMMRGFGEFAS